MSSQDNTKVLLIDTSEFVVLHNRMNGANGIDGFDEIQKDRLEKTGRNE